MLLNFMAACGEKPMREFHDWRHTGIKNAAGAGMSPLAIMRMAGHADFKTTETYVNLADRYRFPVQSRR